jgi:hypothetical protein
VESPLKYQHRCVSIFKDKKGAPTGFALGSVEGRVAIQYVNVANPKDNFTFKCHRSTGAVNGFQVDKLKFEQDTTQITVSNPTLEITPLILGRLVSKPI